MLSLPAIERELRATARQPLTHYLRTVGVMVSLAVSAFFGLNYGFEPALGGQLFAHLHLTLLVAIWVLVPLLSADCISRERREGTLGLLFLTRLTGTGIVLAKGLAHGLRALTLWLAVLPVLTIPFLLGGVGWTEAVLSVLVNLSALCCALAAGLLASAHSKAWHRALIQAVILALVFFCGLTLVTGWLVVVAVGPGAAFNPGMRNAAGDTWSTGLKFVDDALDCWAGYSPFLGAPGVLLGAMGEVTAIALLGLGLAVVLAGAKTRRSFQDQPPSSFRIWLLSIFCTPVLWRSLLRRRLRWKLDHNPVGWLEQRTWSGRLVTWGWLAVIVSLYAAVLSDPNFLNSYAAIQRLIAWLLAGSIALSAAGSFRRERASGLLELLLVSPLTERDIIWGRLRGIWGQFLLAICLLLGIWVWLANNLHEAGEELGPEICFYAATLLTLPAVGLYFSLRCRNFMVAFLATLAVGLLIPVAAPVLVARTWWLYDYSGTTLLSAPTDLSGWAIGCQLLVAGLCLFRLHRRLRRRAFAFTRSSA